MIGRALIALLLFEMFLFPLTALTFTVQGVKNPMDDLSAGLGVGPGSYPGSGTQTGPTSDTVSPGLVNTQSCLAGALGGAIVGGLAGSFLPIIGNIGGLLLGGVAGCLISSSLFPTFGSQAFNTITGALGPLGTFLQTFAVSIQFVGSALAFFRDSVPYEGALLLNAPVIGAFLLPIQLITMALGFFYIAELMRGTAAGSGVQ